MSMTKSVTGLLAEILVVEGRLDDKLKVSSIIPELKDSAFGSATVRQVMDMTTALDYSEDYSDPNADIWIYSKAASPLPKPKDYEGPNGYFEYLQMVRQDGVHGEAFGYRTINSDALGWILSRVTGKDLARLLSERIWSRMGAEQDGYMTVDAKGTPFAGGGLSAGLRDLGRIGLLMLDDGKINGQRLFPKKVVENIRAGGDKKAFAKADYKTLEGGSYRSMWWVFHDEHGAFAARGVHGQTIYVDPTAEMVIVRFASFPTAKNAQIDPTSLMNPKKDGMLSEKNTPRSAEAYSADNLKILSDVDASEKRAYLIGYKDAVFPGANVVDMGCGPGLDSLIMARMVGPKGKVIGIDIADKMLLLAKSLAGTLGITNVEFRCGLMEDLPIDECSADVVVCAGAINLSPQKDKVFATVYRILRNGGKLIIRDRLASKELPADIRGKIG